MATPSDLPGTTPVVQELTQVPDPYEALRRFADLEGALLLESAQSHCQFGRYSFLTADPFRWFQVDRAIWGADPLAPLADFLREFSTETVDALPPFQGGAAGLLSYELGSAWESIEARPDDPGDFPDLAVGVYDCVLAWDHVENRAWVVSQGWPEHRPQERRRRANDRARWMLDRLAGPPRNVPTTGDPVLRRPESPATWLLDTRPEVMSTFSRSGYLESVERIVEYIRAGDVFQANLSQQLIVPATVSPLTLYSRLRSVNPAPFAGYFAGDRWAIVSASPERFLHVGRGMVETRPIKGTRPRSSDAAVDEHLRRELAASAKDQAENVMIVDLMRNDLSRVCRAGTIHVPDLCALESFETVHHLVSTIVGTLEQGKTAWDLLAVCFPGGSITGAPKVRAMEILRELEPTARGPYCGSLFYIGFDGGCDSSILIRTMAVKNGAVRIGVGGGVTASSIAEDEYDETLVKARGMLDALRLPEEHSPADARNGSP